VGKTSQYLRTKVKSKITFVPTKDFCYSIESTEDMSTHISKIDDLAMKLKVTGEPVIWL